MFVVLAISANRSLGIHGVVFVAGLLSPFSHLIQEESVRFTQKDSPREGKAKPRILSAFHYLQHRSHNVMQSA